MVKKKRTTMSSTLQNIPLAPAIGGSVLAIGALHGLNFIPTAHEAWRPTGFMMVIGTIVILAGLLATLRAQFRERMGNMGMAVAVLAVILIFYLTEVARRAEDKHTGNAKTNTFFA